ncbi:Fur family transcriptional regulator [Brevundimonas sp. VNH65]|uniref:Fur family transcriptional regulator n=1 Tax=Brevundimonas sp. VNH65 TaxID=3400917 RepID=UPI003C104944
MGSTCGHDHPPLSPGADAVSQALEAAERRCAEDGDRMTAPRRRVLELLLAAGEPVKAYDLIARFGEDGQAAKPPTVYRALEFLERKGMAHRIASISAYVACTGPDAHAHAAAFLICDCCGATEEVAAPLGDAFTRAAGAAGYALERTTIEGHGRCPACRPAQAA